MSLPTARARVRSGAKDLRWYLAALDRAIRDGDPWVISEIRSHIIAEAAEIDDAASQIEREFRE